MADENVEIRIDATVGGDAADKLKDIAVQARQATQEADRLHHELDSPFPVTPIPTTTGNAAELQKTLTSQVSQAAAGASSSFDSLANKTKGVSTASTQLASTYQLLEEKQSVLAKTAQRGYRTDQPISFLEPQPRRPSVYGLAEDRLPKTKWSTEREAFPIAGATSLAGQAGQGVEPAMPLPRDKRSRADFAPLEEEDEGPSGGGKRPRVGMGRRGLLNMVGGGESGYNALASTFLAGFAAQMAGHAMSGFAHMNDVYSNQSLSGGEKFKQISESIPIIGSLAKGFHDLGDSVSGLNEKVRQSSYAFDLFVAHQAITAATKREQEPLSTKLVETQAQASNAARFRPDYLPPEASNPYSFEQYRRNVPVTRQLFAAQAEKATAGSLIEDATRREKEAREKAKIGAAQVQTHKDALERQRLAGATEKQLKPARLAIAAGYSKQIEAEEEAKRAISDRSKAEERMANASTSERETHIQGKRNELDDVNEKEAKLRGRFATFGGMQAGTRSMALQAARQAKALGYESLGEYQKGLVKSVAPDYAREREEEIGKKYGADEFAKLIPSRNEDKRSLGELQADQVKLNQVININVDLNTEEFKRDIQEKVGGAIKEVKIEMGKIDFLKKEAESNKKALEAAGNT
jgi:hypothetical protein